MNRVYTYTWYTPLVNRAYRTLHAACIIYTLIHDYRSSPRAQYNILTYNKNSERRVRQSVREEMASEEQAASEEGASNVKKWRVKKELAREEWAKDGQTIAEVVDRNGDGGEP